MVRGRQPECQHRPNRDVLKPRHRRHAINRQKIFKLNLPGVGAHLDTAPADSILAGKTASLTSEVWGFGTPLLSRAPTVRRIPAQGWTAKRACPGYTRLKMTRRPIGAPSGREERAESEFMLNLRRSPRRVRPRIGPKTLEARAGTTPPGVQSAVWDNVFFLAPRLGRLVILIGYTQGRPAAGQPWADILRTFGARLANGVSWGGCPNFSSASSVRSGFPRHLRCVMFAGYLEAEISLSETLSETLSNELITLLAFRRSFRRSF
jgi:hypothetical protein